MIIPPIKCQGIKTKIVPLILECIPAMDQGRWIEPFCGSGVVALNVQPQNAILCDTNKHIIGLYTAIQQEEITPSIAKKYLEIEGRNLSEKGERHYYFIRDRFNEEEHSLDFLFLNRSCFNGVMRFNRKGKFNVPFGHKIERFRQAYITKIVNQIKRFSEVVRGKNWTFRTLSFEETFALSKKQDFLYVDPPYLGRHVDYFNSWSEEDEQNLTHLLKNLPCRFLLSTWHSNKYRTNPVISLVWSAPGYFVRMKEHFYHVGSTEDLRNAVYEALISNYPLPEVVEFVAAEEYYEQASMLD